jgi:glycine/D-amino acid oxidase-like deaminating enzyme
MPSVIVVGAGVFGSALARSLAIDGWDVTVVEQESPGWDGSSSGGESRLIRWSHGHERWYARSARRARELWIEIDPSLVVDCGVAWFAHRDDGWEADSERVLREERIPVERLEPGEAQRLFPSLGGGDLAWVLFEPDAGVLRAGRAVQMLAQQARDAGARFVRGRAAPEGAAVRAGGRLLEADHVVWACGPWLAKFFPELAHLRVTRQVVLFYGAPAEWRGTPGWVDYDRSFYGTGDIDDWGVKVAPDAEGPAADPDALGEPGDATEALAREYIAERFPALRGASLLRARTCPYELTGDTHFIAAPHPEHPSVWLLGGGSGHGFKHAPALAERMGRWLVAEEPPDERFALGPRSPDRSLRTAGARATPIGRRLPEAGS